MYVHVCAVYIIITDVVLFFQGISILGESLYGTSPTSPDVPLTRTCGGHLLQKAGSAYLTLTISCTNTNKYGRALRYARCALLCFRECVYHTHLIQDNDVFSFISSVYSLVYQQCFVCCLSSYFHCVYDHGWKPLF